MTTASTSVDGTSSDRRDRKVWLLVAAGSAVLAIALSSLAINEVTRAARVATAPSAGTDGEFFVRRCRTHADGLDPRPDHVLCDGLFYAEEDPGPERSTVMVEGPPPADGSGPVKGWQVWPRGFGEDVSAAPFVATATVVLVLALVAWAGTIRAYRKAGGGRRRREIGSPA
jgi:hypothetical protein